MATALRLVAQGDQAVRTAVRTGVKTQEAATAGFSGRHMLGLTCPECVRRGVNAFVAQDIWRVGNK